MDEEAKATLSKATCSLDQAAALLGLSRPSVVEAIERGDIAGEKFGRKWVIPTAPLRRILRLDDAPRAPETGAPQANAA